VDGNDLFNGQHVGSPEVEWESVQLGNLCCSATRPKYRGKSGHCKYFMLRRSTLVWNAYSGVPVAVAEATPEGMEECPAMTDRSQAALAAIEAAGERPRPLPRSAFRRFVPLTTRWLDNDVYGHINNVVYYEFFDTAVNAVLIEAGALDIAACPVIGYVVETHCNYFAPLSFPQPLEAGIRVGRIGGSSVRYEIGIFAAGGAETAARGHFVHVYRATERPVPLPDRLRQVVKELA